MATWAPFGKPFICIKELSIDINNPSIATTNIDKLLDIHDQHILNNFHETDENKSKDILELLEQAENAPEENEDINRTTSIRRKSPLYGYLIRHKWYEQKISNTFSEEEINEALRSQKDNKSVGMDLIPSEIFKVFRTRWVEILKTYLTKYIMETW